MNTRFLAGSLMSGLLVLVLALPTTASAADVAHQVQGSFVVTIDPQSVRVQPLGATCRIGLTATFSFTGGLNGAFTAPFSILHAGACDQPATEVFSAQGTYTGSAAGVQGSLEFVFAGTIDPAGHALGELVVLRGSGGLADVHGAIRLDGQSGVGGTYGGVVVLRQ